MTTLYLIRHGEVENPKDIFYGRLPHFHLSAQGRQQAEAAARQLREQPLAAVFSSPLLRTRQTAQIILREHPGLRLHISQLLVEVLSPYEGYPRAQLNQLGWDIYTGISAPHETPQDVLRRGIKFVQGIRRKYAGQQVAAVTHGDIIAFLSMWAQGHPVNQQRKALHYPAPASITQLTFNESDPEPAFAYFPVD